MQIKSYRGALGLMVALTLTSTIALAQQRVNPTVLTFVTSHKILI